MAQRIVTLIGTISRYSYSITEYIVDMDKIVNRICKTPLYKFFNKKSIVQDFLMYNEFATTITKESDPVR